MRRHQPRIRATRLALAAIADPRIRRAIESEASYYGVSHSWIIASRLALAYSLLIPMPDTPPRKRRHFTGKAKGR